ncbi:MULTISPECIES: ADP compounds hydrolase NudE [unclassified Agarivorans]|uniref:ADP compounds hydrolase NudE n=1 Tax=unclassified Agarivorans TaxID=2636026 RepID=UPI0010DAA44E|nr:MULTISPECIES: ADP compounds hydrolase NudE [unclassified Agarivorans]MDO6765734.1 ADP compounds hydrolase NudE [Agarivorans sp. 1_MG-2023]GDY27713.1 ADP compounds hydrolase NudE [Agarivorans sp. Toyoura001]
MSKHHPPRLLDSAIAAESRFFKIEELHLEFSNGEKRIYERLVGSGQGAVMILPITEQNELLLISEYAAGTERYELGFAKGLVDRGETALEAANRELQEEIGFKANSLQLLTELSVAPGYFSSHMSVFVAQGLEPSVLEGDEPEPLEVIKVPLNQIDSLYARKEFSEARSVASLLLLEKWLTQNKVRK